MGRRRRDDQFDSVRERLPGQQSPYEWAWHHLAPSVGYPNSAVFAEKVWQRDFALLLCEIDWPTIAELGQWCDSVRRLDRCKTAELFPGDWRNRFAKGLPSSTEVGLLDGSLTLVSFDPDWCDSTRQFADGQGVNGRRVYPDDFCRTLAALKDVKGPFIIQLSTYNSSSGGNRRIQNRPTHEDVAQSVNGILHNHGFERCVEVRLDDKMMSLVCVRNIPRPWVDELADLPRRFRKWLLAA